MGNLLITGVISKAAEFNAIEFYALGDGDAYSDYFLLQQGGVPQSGTNQGFSLDGGTNTPIVKGTFWRITDDAAAFSAYFGEPADYVTNNLSLFFGTNIVDLIDNNGLLDRYGEIGTNSWNYGDGWAYRNDGFDTGNDGAFVETNWSINQDLVALCTINDTCDCRFPLGTYNPTGTAEPPVCSPSRGSKSGKAKSEKAPTAAKSEKAPTTKSAKAAPSPPSPPSMMATSLGVDEDVAQDTPKEDMDNTTELLVGLLLDLFTKPDQAVGDTGSIRDTLGGALMMFLDLFKDYENDGGRRGLRAALGADAIAKEDMEKLETKLIKVLNELRE